MHERAFSTAAGPVQRNELVACDGERDAVHRSHLATAAGIMSMHVNEGNHLTQRA